MIFFLGHTGTGIANSLGASSLGIVLCLGVPWAISAIMLNNKGEEAIIYLHSYGVQYTILSLLLVSLSLFSVLAISGFKLRKLTGVALGILYLSFVTYAVMVELDYLFPTPNVC